MLRFTQTNFFKLTLLPVFVLAHLLCICNGLKASPQQQLPSQPAPSEHACCDTKSSDTQNDGAPAPKHEHDPGCTHCGDPSTLTVPDAASRIADPAKSVTYAPLSPILFDHLAFEASNRFDSFSRYLTDPSPPPDLLRVKCSLQI